MAIDKIKQNSDLIGQVERYLNKILTDNDEFNDALDESELIEVRSLKEGDPYLYKASEVLYWVDRGAYVDEFTNWNGVQLRDKHSMAINYIDESNQGSVISDLIGLVKKKKVAPFVGAGVSAAAGYPGWGDTLSDLGGRLNDVDDIEIQQLLNANDYLTLAQTLYDASPSQLNNHIRTEFRIKSDIEDDKEKIPDVIKLLPKLCAGAMLTTNFDTLIEGWFKARVSEEFDGILCGKQENHNFVTKLLKGERCLLKLHGDASQPDSHVFTSSQYDEGYGTGDIDFSKQLPKALRQIYISHSLLFLGCSLQQDKTIELFNQVRSEGHFVIPEHFALLPFPMKEADVGGGYVLDDVAKQQIEDRLYQLEIRPIWYSPDDGHTMLVQLLQLIVDVSDGRLSLRG